MLANFESYQSMENWSWSIILLLGLAVLLLAMNNMATTRRLVQPYLIFVIFFTRAKFFENKIYTKKTRKLRQNTQ